MNVKNLLATLAIALLLIAARPAFAVETIGWEALVPPMDESLDPYPRLDEAQQDSLYDLWMVRERRKLGSVSDDLDRLEKEATDNLAEGGIDAAQIMKELDDFLALLEANKTRLVDSLDGKDVRIPGYVLPTEYNGDEVVEFLLVPYVGACIHTPAPPLNQLVQVRVEEGFTSEGMFAPVWVTGRMNTDTATQSLYLVDGAMDVESGYKINASDVAPYE